MTTDKVALLIGTSAYEDPKFSRLRAPAHDVAELARVLSDPSVGGFDVHTLIDEQSWLISEAIEGLFADRGRDDLLVLYFSCHGVKDPTGRLYFATTNTRAERLASTGISSAWVNEQLDRSRCQRVVVLLDCCYSGSYARGLAPRSNESVYILERLGGRGRAVITACDGMEYAYEDDELSLDVGQPSLFSRALIDGLETGDADLDNDGLVGVEELYGYVYERVRRLTPHQTPTWSAHGLKGDLYLARNPRYAGFQGSATLPIEVYQAADSELTWQRAGALICLSSLLSDKGSEFVPPAMELLRRLHADTDAGIRKAAATLLNSVEQGSHDDLDQVHRLELVADAANESFRLDRLLAQATVKLEVHSIRVDVEANSPILLLREATGSRRVLPIWIRNEDANPISYVLHDIPRKMPVTHDLLTTMLATCTDVDMLAITELTDGTFKGAVRLHSNSTRHSFLARASDVAALAVRLKVPVYTSTEIMDYAGVDVDLDDR